MKVFSLKTATLTAGLMVGTSLVCLSARTRSHAH